MRDAPDTRWQRHAPFCCCTLISAHVCSFALQQLRGCCQLFCLLSSSSSFPTESCLAFHWKCFKILQAHSSFICRTCVLLLLLHGLK